ncbi:MAG: DUF4252 domain-containing protein [Bacteroidetes bacterium]|nr:DUF4252 domain-containing protein [Bacteroidota bacterium]
MKNKTLLLLMIFVSLPFFLPAQTNPLDDMIKLYKGQEGFYFLDLKTNMMNAGDKGQTGVSDAVVNLVIISFDEKKNTSFKAENLYNQFFSTVDKAQYKGLIDIKSSGDNVEMMIKNEGERLTEVIIAVQEEDEMTIIVATGNFDLKDLARFKNMQQCHGLQVLEQLCEE